MSRTYRLWPGHTPDTWTYPGLHEVTPAGVWGVRPQILPEIGAEEPRPACGRRFPRQVAAWLPPDLPSSPAPAAPRAAGGVATAVSGPAQVPLQRPIL